MLLNPNSYRLPSIAQQFKEANQDSDAALFWFLGASAKASAGAVIVIKGRKAALKAYGLFANHGLLTPGKPIIDAKKTTK